jgi:cobalt-zinc-cadmium efflux system outer membrane protein
VKRVLWWGFVIAAWPVASAGQQETLTLEQVLNRARTHGPAILAARDRIDEARGRLRGASILLRDNPEVEASAGPRSGTNMTDVDFALTQTFELGGRRGARIAGGRADVDRETAASQNTARELLRDVAAAFWRAVAAEDRVRLANEAHGVASELLHSMERRYEVGDVPILDVNVTRVSAARARLEVRGAEGDLAVALGDLRVFLGMAAEAPLAVRGDLRQHRSYQPDELIAEALNRPDLRAISAEIRQAEAEVRLGRSFAWPDLGLGFKYERDEGDTVTKGGLTLTLPIFSRGQELRATGEARARRLGRELAAGQRAVANQVRTGLDVYQRKVDAAQELERNALQSLAENETLARRSFEEGEINLIELLLIRRESFETRLFHLNQLLEAALAGVEVEARAGVLK